MKTHNASLIKDFLIYMSYHDFDELLTNLKVQKMLYYFQGFHLAIFGTKLFNSSINKWALGPVVPSIYRELKHFGNTAIPSICWRDEFDDISQEQINLMHEVYDVYGQYSAWKLSELTHEELPWQNTNDNDEISPRLMQVYFKSQINE